MNAVVQTFAEYIQIHIKISLAYVIQVCFLMYTLQEYMLKFSMFI